MRKGVLLAAASVLVLAACSPASEDADGSQGAESAAETATSSAPATTRATAPARADAAEGEAPMLEPAPIARLAYAFTYGLSVPRDRGAELMSRHELTCAAAGPGICQVISSRADWTGREPGGRLELRGQPDWINRFRSGLALDAQNAGGRLDQALTDGEDVTRATNTAAAGAATSAALSERIRDLQRQRGGTLAQRLEIERQLGDLQRQQDAHRIALNDLDTRVQTARLVLDYREGGVMAADSPTRPVVGALRDAFGLSMSMLAVLVTVGSVMLPVAVIGGAVWWGLVRRRRRPAGA